VSEASADAGFDVVSVWVWISSRPNEKTPALLVLRIHGETFSGVIPWLKCKESADNGNGRVIVIGSSVAVGSDFAKNHTKMNHILRSGSKHGSILFAL
jgi:hypothetical protein